MVLQSLVKYYDSLAKDGKVPKMGWSLINVSYVIYLSEDGKIKGIISQKTEKQYGKEKYLTPKTMSVPEHFVRSGKNPPPYFLCDNSKYLLGIDYDDKNKSISICSSRFEMSKELHLSLLDSIDTPMAKAICNFYRTWNLDNVEENELIMDNIEEITKGANLIFCMSNQNANDDESIINAWNDYLTNNNRDSTEKVVKGICAVTGKYTEIARVHSKIKGVPGGQACGTSLVSFNSSALESYGKEQGYNASISKEAEFKYTTALNYLLANKKCKMQLGDMVVVFWSETGEESYQSLFCDSVMSTTIDNQKELCDIFKKIKYQRYIDVDDVQLDTKKDFYILGLSPNSARLSIRLFCNGSFGDILLNIKQHYDRLEIIKPNYVKEKMLDINKILCATLPKNQSNNKDKKDKKDKKFITDMTAKMLQSIMFNTNYPERIYTDVLNRAKIECGELNWERVAIIKAFLIKNRNMEGDNFMYLNEKCSEKAYLLGRLFSVLESVQVDSRGNNNQLSKNDQSSTIKDKYFIGACTTPSLVFPMLMKLNVSHMKKLERNNKNKKVYYEKLMMSILNMFEVDDCFPVVNTLEEQGKFVLGYYHQLEEKYRKNKNVEDNESK